MNPKLVVGLLAVAAFAMAIFIWRGSESIDTLRNPELRGGSDKPDGLAARREKPPSAKIHETALESTSTGLSSATSVIRLEVVDQDRKPCPDALIQWLWEMDTPPDGWDDGWDDLEEWRFADSAGAASGRTDDRGGLNIPRQRGRLTIRARSYDGVQFGTLKLVSSKVQAQHVLQLWRRNLMRVQVLDASGQTCEKIEVGIFREASEDRDEDLPSLLVRGQTGPDGVALMPYPADLGSWRLPSIDELFVSFAFPCRDAPKIPLEHEEAERDLGVLTLPPAGLLRLQLAEEDRRGRASSQPLFEVWVKDPVKSGVLVEQLRPHRVDLDDGIQEFGRVGVGLEIQVDIENGLAPMFVEGSPVPPHAVFSGPSQDKQILTKTLPPFQAGPRLRGRILDESGSPLPHAKLVLGFRGGIFDNVADCETITLDAESRMDHRCHATIASLLPHLQNWTEDADKEDKAGAYEREFLTLSLLEDPTPPGWQSRNVMIPLVSKDPNQTLELGTLRLRGPETLLHGRVVDSEGRPVPEAEVWNLDAEEDVDWLDLRNSNLRCDESGKFRFGKPGPFDTRWYPALAQCRIWARAPGFRPTSAPCPADRESPLILTLKKGHSFAFTVLVDEGVDTNELCFSFQGRPFDDISTSSTRVNDRVGPSSRTHAIFRCDWLQSGSFEFQLDLHAPFKKQEGLRLAEGRVSVPEESHRLIDLRGEIPLAEISATDEDGRPMQASLSTQADSAIDLPCKLPRAFLSRECWIHSYGYLTQHFPSRLPTEPVRMERAPEVTILLEYLDDPSFDLDQCQLAVAELNKRREVFYEAYHSVQNGRALLAIPAKASYQFILYWFGEDGTEILGSALVKFDPAQAPARYHWKFSSETEDE